ncbi:hypothetical protein V8E36_006381 [Tilletia maclaganii]
MFAKAKQGLAHNTVAPTLLGNRDLKLLQSIISTEKDFVKSNTRSASDFKDTADAIKLWGDAEGPDLSDVLGKLCTLFQQYEAGVERYHAHVSNIRLHFKSIRTREEGLADLKARKRALAARIDSLEKKLSKMGPENKQLMQTTGQLKDSRNEMVSMEADVRSEESALGDFKRRTARDALTLKCGGLQELAEKQLIIAASGRVLVEQIPQRVTPPGGPRADYNAYPRTDQVLQDAIASIANVSFRLGSTVATDPTGALTSPHAPSLYDGGDDSSSQIHPIYAQHASNPTATAMSPPSAQSEPLAPIPEPTPVDSQVTPIAARFASNQGGTGHGAQGSISTDGYKDVAADEWGKAAGLAVAGASGRVATPPPDTEAAGSQSFWRDVDPVQEANISVANKLSLSTATATQQAPSSSAQHAGSAPPIDIPPSSDSRAPRLQVVNVTPPPENERPSRTALNTGETRNQFSSNTTSDRDFDRSYFTEIGSTRALQESVRRPTSPPGTGSPSPAVQRFTAGSSPANLPPASPSTANYEPPEGGRKMSAAAFKRGFARVPSAQAGPSSAAYGGGPADEVSSPVVMTPTMSGGSRPAGNGSDGHGYGITGNGGAGADIEPLHIRKRMSVASGIMLNSNSRIAAEEGMDDAAPPYAPSPVAGAAPVRAGGGLGAPPSASNAHPASIYGGLDGMEYSAAAQYVTSGGAEQQQQPASHYQQAYQHATPWATPMSQTPSTEYQGGASGQAPPRTQLPPGGW